MPACRLIVCEKTDHWAPLLREALGNRQPKFIETRSLAGCEAELTQSPASLVAVEATTANLEAVSQFVANVHENFPRAVVVALVAMDADGAASVLREAGAFDAINSVLELQRVARMAQRQFALAPQQTASLQDFVTELMPWPAQATTQE